MTQGTVRWFDGSKGYGFLTDDDGRDIFVHTSAIEMDGFSTLEGGQRVEFEIAPSEVGLQAEAVRVIPVALPDLLRDVARSKTAPWITWPNAIEPSPELLQSETPGSALGPDDPRFVGRYSILSRLGEGAMGVVYLATSTGSSPVALKVVRPEYAHDRIFVQRFAEESELARHVASTYTARVIAAVSDANRPHLVTEYIDGPTLHDYVARNGALAPSNAKALAIGTAAALIAVHDAGIIHRDLKPQNVMLSRHGPRVIDFGIARSLAATTRLTQAGQRVGAPAYMSPEQINDHVLSPATDVFSWAGVMVYATTGHPPFGSSDATIYAVFYKILDGEPNLSGVPHDLRGIIENAFSKDPQARPTARQLLSSITGVSAIGDASAVADAAIIKGGGRRAKDVSALEDRVKSRLGADRSRKLDDELRDEGPRDTVSLSMPTSADGFTAATVMQWMLRVGDPVWTDQPLLRLLIGESDIEIPSPVSGILRQITVDEDENAAMGEEICIIEVNGVIREKHPVIEIPNLLWLDDKFYGPTS